MCLVVSLIFLALAYTFFQEDNMQGVYLSISVAFLFIFLLIRNILKTKKERKQ